MKSKSYIIKILLILLPFFILFSCTKDKENKSLNDDVTTKKDKTGKVSEKSYSEVYKDTIIEYSLGNKIIRINIISGNSPEFVFLNVHENEKTSINTARDIARKYGSKFIYLSNAGNRNISFELNNETYTFDPNRIFSIPGIRKTLKNLGGYSKNAESEVNKFAQFIIKEIIPDSKYVIAVHNNTEGSYSADSYYGEYKKDGASIFKIKSEDPDDFFFVTRDIDFEYLKSKGFNVILQDNENVRDDGSLSVYCGKHDIPYINVETLDGKYKKQYEMLETIIEKIINE